MDIAHPYFRRLSLDLLIFLSSARLMSNNFVLMADVIVLRSKDLISDLSFACPSTNENISLVDKFLDSSSLSSHILNLSLEMPSYNSLNCFIVLLICRSLLHSGSKEDSLTICMLSVSSTPVSRLAPFGGFIISNMTVGHKISHFSGYLIN